MRIKQLFTLFLVVAFAGPAMALSSSIQATIEYFGYHLKNYNIGMMTALMSNLDQTSAHTTCVVSATATSAEVFKLLDFEDYLNGGFNLGVFMNSLNVVFIKMMQQFEDCGVQELYIRYDNIMSHVSDISSLGVNLAVMIGTGWKNKDTAPYVVWDLWQEGWKHRDWLDIGKGLQLLFAQLAKYDAPELSIEVNIMEYN